MSNQVTLRIKRFNPEKNSKPWWAEYQVTAEPTDRLLDALVSVESSGTTYLGL